MDVIKKTKKISVCEISATFERYYKEKEVIA